MISFRFTCWPDQEPESGFDMGDMEIEGERGSSTSAGRSPDQGMMIFLSLVLLLDGLACLETRHRGSFSFVAVDSSFRVDFRSKDRTVTVTNDGRTLGRPSRTELLHAVLAAAEEFAARELPGIPEDDAGRQDLEVSLAEFRRLLSPDPRAPGPARPGSARPRRAGGRTDGGRPGRGPRPGPPRR